MHKNRRKLGLCPQTPLPSAAGAEAKSTDPHISLSHEELLFMRLYTSLAVSLPKWRGNETEICDLLKLVVYKLLKGGSKILSYLDRMSRRSGSGDSAIEFFSRVLSCALRLISCILCWYSDRELIGKC